MHFSLSLEVTEYLEIISQNRPQTGWDLYQMPSGSRPVLQPYTSLPDPVYLEFIAQNGEFDKLDIIIIRVYVCVPVAHIGEERGCIGFWWGNQRERDHWGWPRRRWVDNIRMDLQEVGCGYVDWIGLAQDRDRWRTLVSAVMNLRFPLNAGNFLTSCKPVSCSRRTLHHEVIK